MPPGAAEPPAPDSDLPHGQLRGPARGRRALRWAGAGLVLVGLALAGAGGWLRLWLPLQAQLAELTRQHGQLARRLEALEAWRAGVNDELASLGSRSRDLEQRLERLGPAQQVEWSLAEAAYLLRSAQRAAVVEYDPARAAQTLELAAASLEPVPHSDALRQALAQARAALQQVQVPDLNALGQDLARAAAALRSAPLREAGTAPPPGAPGWRGTLQQLWDRLGDIIVVQRVDAPVQPLLRPQERVYLRQQLALKLAAADLALRQRDSLALQAELGELRSWAEAYLDTRQPATAEALATLARLASLELRPPLPDLSALDAQLQALRRALAADHLP